MKLKKSTKIRFNGFVLIILAIASLAMGIYVAKTSGFAFYTTENVDLTGNSAVDYYILKDAGQVNFIVMIFVGLWAGIVLYLFIEGYNKLVKGENK